MPARPELFDPPEHGIHSWLFGRAAYLKKANVQPEEAARLIEQKVDSTSTRRPVTAKEIADAVATAYQVVVESRYRPRPNHRPEFRESVALEIGRAGPDVVDLWEMSERRFDEEPPNPGFFLSHLFSDDDLVCLARRFDEAGEVRTFRDWRGCDLTGCQFVVPNPMTAKDGTTLDGRTSPRTKNNATVPLGRRHLVVEIDRIQDEDTQAGIIAWLGRKADLRLVLHSGGKSLHAWFRIAGMPFPAVQRFARLAVELGADSAAFRTSQLVRLPDGRRDNGKRQHIIFYTS